MKKILLLFGVCLISCVEQGQPVSINAKGNFKVELLFEKDSCKVYRFEDGGRYVYWSNCQGKITYDQTINTGKSSVTHHEEIINN